MTCRSDMGTAWIGGRRVLEHEDPEALLEALEQAESDAEERAVEDWCERMYEGM